MRRKILRAKGDLGERLAWLISESGCPDVGTFCDWVGINRSSVDKYIYGQRTPAIDFFRSIKQAFPLLSYDWLIDGNGTPWLDYATKELLFSERRSQTTGVDPDEA